MSTPNQVVTLNKSVTLSALRALIKGDVMAIRIDNYSDAETCEAVAARMVQSKHYGRYVNAPKIARVGKALFECVGNRSELKEYLDSAPCWMEEMRVTCAPFASPIDRFRLECDVVWPGGARVARVDGRPAFAGLLRVFSEGSFAEPHQDHLAWDLGPLGLKPKQRAQIAVNVYLKLPAKGGELVIWPHGLSREAYEKARNPGSYGVSESALRGTPLVIRPRQGEMWLFLSTNTHKVEESRGGDRVTWSCFIGANSEREPLEFWS